MWMESYHVDVKRWERDGWQTKAYSDFAAYKQHGRLQLGPSKQRNHENQHESKFQDFSLTCYEYRYTPIILI